MTHPRAVTNASAGERLERDLLRLHSQTDRMMLVILLAQWVLAIVIAATFSPYGWAGKVRSVHLHVEIAIFGGAALNSLPLYLILRHPGWWFTRHVVAVCQMLWSGLLIHLTGGRIETHFHVFGSLAFLAFYRDWKILPTATAVVVGDHLLRGFLLPESVYGTANPEWWRFLEHAFWVAFEDIVLFLGCRRGMNELRQMADREAVLAELNVTLEERVATRTAEVEAANAQLKANIDDLTDAQRQISAASRRAGMADVATSVLHNVGNVLNSVNVSTGLIIEELKRSKSGGLAKATTMLKEQPDLGTFLTHDERGKRLPAYLCAVSDAIGEEQKAMLSEAESLQKNIDHIKVIVARQQDHAKGGDIAESVVFAELADEAIAMTAAPSVQDGVAVVRDYGALPTVRLDRHKVLQILVNLLSNARHAVRSRGTITVRLQARDAAVAIVVEDDGVGIDTDNLARIFTLGFTTRPDGHGFGLHGSACSAMDLGGALTARSDGEGRGAAFTLELPLQPQAPNRMGRTSGGVRPLESVPPAPAAPATATGDAS